MTKGKDKAALDWEALRLGTERCDTDLLVDFYAEDARLSIVNADAPHASPFVLSGKAEIAKHLGVTFGPETSHCVEREAAIGDDRMTFRESCELPGRRPCARRNDAGDARRQDRSPGAKLAERRLLV